MAGRPGRNRKSAANADIKEENVLQYSTVTEGTFISRPNRFTAWVEMEGREVLCHVRNTGRCRELLVPGARVYLEESSNPNRKTRYSLIAVIKGGRLINMDSQAPNRAAGEWLAKGGLFSPVTLLKAETRYGASRFDFYGESGDGEKHFVEVKGVTLEENGVVLFPDAPTQRGEKHLRELCQCSSEGYRGHILFVVQMSHVRYFTPNRQTDPAFAAALEEAERCGVEIRAVECRVTPDSMTITREVPVRLTEEG